MVNLRINEVLPCNLLQHLMILDQTKQQKRERKQCSILIEYDVIRAMFFFPIID